MMPPGAEQIVSLADFAGTDQTVNTVNTTVSMAWIRQSRLNLQV